MIPKVAELHNMIAKLLVDKPNNLRGDELRFLRKYAGLPANRFAALLDINPSTLSRAENGKKVLSRALDKLARALAMAARDQEYTKNVLLEVAAGRMRDKRTRHSAGKQYPLFRLVSNRWTTAA